MPFRQATAEEIEKDFKPRYQQSIQEKLNDKEKENIVEKFADFLGIRKFGQGIGAAAYLNLTKEGRDMQKKAMSGDKHASSALNAVVDTAPSSKEILGSAAMTGLNILSAGTLKGASAASAAARSASAASRVAKGSAVGAAYGTAGAAEQDKNFGDGVKQALVGALTGGALSAAGVAANKAKNAISKGGQAVAERTMNSAVKPAIEETKKQIEYGGKTLGRELIDREIKGGSKKLFEIAKQRLNENGKKLDVVLREKHADKIITRQDIVKDFKGLISEKMGTPTLSAKNDIEKIKSAFSLIPQKMTVFEANKIKRRLYKELGSKAYKLDPNLGTEAEISEKIAESLRKNIEKKTGDVSVRLLNKELSIFKQLKDAARDNITRTSRNQIAGVGTIGAITEKVIGAVPVKTRAAVSLDKLSKAIGNIKADSAGRISKQAILNAVNDAMK